MFGSQSRIPASASLPLMLIGYSSLSTVRKMTAWALGSRSAVPLSRHITDKYGRPRITDQVRPLHFQFPAVQVALNEMAEDCMLTTGIDSKNSKISHLSGESGGIGYQSILDALPTPSDDGFLGCHQSQAKRHEFSGDASVLTGSAAAAFSCGIWAFSTDALMN